MNFLRTASQALVRGTIRGNIRIALSTAVALPWMSTAAQEGAPLWRWRESRAADSPAPELTRIGSVIGHERYGLVLTQPADGLVLLFTTRGALTKSVGKLGEGPGEFRNGWLAVWRADSILISDPALRRLTIVDLTGKVVRNQPFPRAVYRGAGNERQEAQLLGIFPQGMLANNDLIVDVVPAATQLRSWWSGGTDAPNGATIRTATDGRFLDLLFVHPARNPACNARYRRGNGLASIRIPYCEHPLVIHSPAGDRHAVIRTSAQDEIEARVSIELFTSTSGRPQTRTMNVQRTRIAQWRMDSAKSLLKASFARDPQATDAVEQIRFPHFLPVVRDGLFSSDGWLWLELWEATDVREWVAFDLDGRLAGRIRIPSDIVVRGAAGPTLFATRKSEFDEETVVILSVER